MSVVEEMLDTYPRDLGNIDRDALAICIKACVDCAQACTACADACLSEAMVAELTKCIRLDLDCADMCEAAGRVLSRHTGYDANITHAMLAACATACQACGDECQSHADMHEHCRVCAEACRQCEAACNDLSAPSADPNRGELGRSRHIGAADRIRWPRASRGTPPQTSVPGRGLRVR